MKINVHSFWGAAGELLCTLSSCPWLLHSVSDCVGSSLLILLIDQLKSQLCFIQSCMSYTFRPMIYTPFTRPGSEPSTIYFIQIFKLERATMVSSLSLLYFPQCNLQIVSCLIFNPTQNRQDSPELN